MIEAERARCLRTARERLCMFTVRMRVQMVEQSIMASGVLLLTGMSMLLIVRDLSHLSG